jgi:hypothetical protein
MNCCLADRRLIITYVFLVVCAMFQTNQQITIVSQQLIIIPNIMYVSCTPLHFTAPEPDVFESNANDQVVTDLVPATDSSELGA